MEWSELKKMYLDEKWGAQGSGGDEKWGAQGCGGWGEAGSEQWATASNSWAQDAATPKKVAAPVATQQVRVALICSFVSGAGRGRQSAMVAYCT